jgi:hypothetical protein
MSDTERDHLEGLLTHPGWLLLKEKARREWGAEGYGQKVRSQIGMANRDEIVPALKAIDVAATEINALLSWPKERLKHLTATPEHAESESLRRGPV